MSKLSFFISLLTGILFGLLAGWVWKYYTGGKQTQPSNTVNDTLYEISYDTLYYDIPVARDSVVTRYVTKYATVNQLVVDSVAVRDGDTIPISLPITQKFYRDSTYEAWVSGYEANLDSINVFGKTVTRIICKTTNKTKRWGLGPHIGGGYGLHGFTPYVGIGVQYNLLNW